MTPPGAIMQRPPNEHRLELLVDAVADYAIYMLDTNGIVTSWNKGAEKIKGYAPSEILGQHFSRFFTPDDRTAGLPETILEAALKEGRHEAEGWRVRKDGSLFWSNAIIQQVRDESGVLVGFAKITRDITERVEIQNALLESERRFRILVEGVVDYAIYMLDPSGIVSNWNAGAERLKGYRAHEIVGQHFSKFYTPEDRRIGLPARVLETVLKEGRFEAEGWRIRKDGTRFWASVVIDAIRNDRGELEGFAKVTRDITERQAAQDAIRESERQFRLLVDGVTDYALYMLDPNGVIVSWNAGAERIKNYRADEIIGQHFSRFYTDRDRAAGKPTKALYAAAQEGNFEAEGWRVRKDGSLFWASVVIDPIRDDVGDLIGFAKITRDISERRAAQQALEEANAQRAQAQKMDAIGQLTGGVAHDFNNLLMVISGNIRTLKRNIADDPKLKRAAESIELAAERGASLTRQLLTFSRRQTVKPTVVSLEDSVGDLRTMLGSSIGSSVKLVTTIATDAWAVTVDASELCLALVNLSINARDAMESGGIIAITSENVTLAPGDTAAGIVGDFVALRISDTGAGIAPDVLPKVFDPFFTTKGVDKGTGLGLSQVYGFAHQSGGTVAIESELGRGTIISVYLPRSQPASLEAKAEAEVERLVDATVLVVEDNPDVSEVTISMLEQLGYRVLAAASAEAALQAISRQNVDLVVSDIVMPGALDGIALAKAIREKWPNLPVLLVTGYAESASEAGADHLILRKPFELSELSHAASRLIAKSNQRAESNVVRLPGGRSADQK